MLRNSMIREMAFKANFLLWMGVELLWFIGQIIFIEFFVSSLAQLQFRHLAQIFVGFFQCSPQEDDDSPESQSSF